MAITDGEGIRATIDLVEPTGFGIIIHAMVEGIDIKLFTQDRSVMMSSKEIRIACPDERLHLFGADGQRVE